MASSTSQQHLGHDAVQLDPQRKPFPLDDENDDGLEDVREPTQEDDINNLGLLEDCRSRERDDRPCHGVHREGTQRKHVGVTDS